MKRVLGFLWKKKKPLWIKSKNKKHVPLFVSLSIKPGYTFKRLNSIFASEIRPLIIEKIDGIPVKYVRDIEVPAIAPFSPQYSDCYILIDQSEKISKKALKYFKLNALPHHISMVKLYKDISDYPLKRYTDDARTFILSNHTCKCGSGNYDLDDGECYDCSNTDPRIPAMVYKAKQLLAAGKKLTIKNVR